MQSNRSSRTKPELLLSKLIRKKIEKHKLPGSPDFVFPRRRVVVFLHGCFWHRCPTCHFDLPKRHRKFWATKFERNKLRDRAAKQELKRGGWRVVEVWEHELRNDPIEVKKRVLLA